MPSQPEKPTPPTPGGTQPPKPAYETPQITTYYEAEILEQLGPAQAGGNYNLMGGV